MTELSASRQELLVAGFGDKQTAFLARAALARLQDELGIKTNEAVLISREPDGGVAMQQVSHRPAGKNDNTIFWEMLTDLLFDLKSDSATNTETRADDCAALGVEPTFISDVEKKLRQCESAIFLLTPGKAQWDAVAGMLRGFYLCTFLSRTRVRREDLISEEVPS
jgi:uncharacterized membrane protein